MTGFYIFIFLASCLVLAFSSKLLVGTLLSIARFLNWKEFVVGFFIMAFATSIPNLFVGIISAINKVPELSFGDVMGANIIDLTLIVGLAALVSKIGLTASSRTVQGTVVFTIGVAILPLVLIQDKILSRFDGVLLLTVFFIYLFWFFRKRERFEKVYDGLNPLGLKLFFKNLLLFSGSILLLLVSAEGIVRSAVFFADFWRFPLGLMGILIIGLGTTLPEFSFVLQAARKNQDWLILGNLMGSVVITTSLVLGIVALLSPIKISDFTPFAIARTFLIAAVLLFLFAIKTDRKITRKEGLFLIGLYFAFLFAEIIATIF